jgi:NSS family neurotransmitter:Na+ symporter
MTSSTLAGAQTGASATSSRPASDRWSSGAAFLAAAVGSAVGLGNIWKFPYMAGVSGGGAFVVLYLAFVFGVGVPVLIAELSVGRRGGPSLIRALGALAAGRPGGRSWNLLGILVALTALVVLSFYSVVAGWALAYSVESATGTLATLSPTDSELRFEALLADPKEMIAWHTLILVVVAAVVARGVRKGIEALVRWMMPLLAVLMVGLAAYAGMVGDFAAAVRFLFLPDLSAITPGIAVAAAGHAFFTLSLGLGAMAVYGAYVPRDVSIPKAALWIAGLDTLCALLAGLAIFPLVFAFGLAPTAGPGLIFVTLPVAFAAMPAGPLIGAVFFGLIVLAALTSAIALIEPLAAALSERGGRRAMWSWMLAGLAWLLGLVSVFSFNIWSDARVLGLPLFDAISHISGDLILPLGGAGFALFVGWIATHVVEETDFGSKALYRLWRLSVRYAAPTVLLVVFVDLLL